MSLLTSVHNTEKIAVVTGGTAKDVFAMGTLALNLKHTNPHLFDEMVIFHDGISAKDQQIFQKIMPTIFIDYQFPEKNVKFSSIVSNFFSSMVFCKYECLKLLKEYRKVLWLDYDMVVLDDISELTASTPSGIKFVISNLTVRDNFKPSIGNCDMKEYNLEHRGITASVIFFENLANYEELYRFCIAQTIKYAQHLFLPEQAIFELMIQKFNLNPTNISWAYSVHPLLERGLELNIPQPIKILHCYAQPKFWNGVHSDLWNKYYQQWVQLGGSRYKFHLGNVLKKIIRKFKNVV